VRDHPSIVVAQDVQFPANAVYRLQRIQQSIVRDASSSSSSSSS